MRNAALTALLTSLLLALVGISLAVSERAKTRARLDQRLALQADGEANAIGGLFARTRLALRLLAGDTAFRDGIPKRRAARSARNQPGARLARARRARPRRRGLGDRPRRPRAGARRARRVPHRRQALARDVRNDAFFRATLGDQARRGARLAALPLGRHGPVVVSNSALVRDAGGTPLGIVRFELALASVRSVAAAALGGEQRRRGRARRPRQRARDPRHGPRRARLAMPGRRPATATWRRRGRPRHRLGGRQPPRLPRADGHPGRPGLGRRRGRPAAVPARCRRALARRRSYCSRSRSRSPAPA